MRIALQIIQSLFVSGSAKTGHVATNYTLSFNTSFFSIGTEYFYPVTFIA